MLFGLGCIQFKTGTDLGVWKININNIIISYSHMLDTETGTIPGVIFRKDMRKGC